MAYVRKFLHPVRQSLTGLASSSSSTHHPKQFFCSNLEPLRRLIKGSESVLCNRSAKFHFISNAQRTFLKSFYFSGGKVRVGSVLGASAVFGVISIWPHVSYAMDGLENLENDYLESMGPSDVERDAQALWSFVRRFWVPVLFFLTLLANLEDPVVIFVVKVLLFLVSTKPNPFSVYVAVNELCLQTMRREPYLYLTKSLYARRVEVQDYKLVCLAKVEISDQEFTLLGILGGWWPLPS